MDDEENLSRSFQVRTPKTNIFSLPCINLLTSNICLIKKKETSTEAK